MKELFIEKKFNPKHLGLIEKADTIITNYARQGYDLSLRQLYYQFVAHHGLPNSEQNYKLLGNVVSDARDAGLLDWEKLVDRGRVPTLWASYDDPADLIASSRFRYAVDMWKDQPWHVEIMVEKQALEGVLRPVASRLQVPFNANKGYSSASALYRAGKRLAEAFDEGKSCAVIYLGDHDPSGIDMSRDVDDRLRLYSRADEYGEILKIERIALNMPQIRQYNPPPNPAKMTDSRAGGYVSSFGYESWELDALDPSVLAEITTDAVNRYINRIQWDEDKARQQVDLVKIDRLVSKYRDGSLESLLGVELGDDNDSDEYEESED